MSKDDLSSERRNGLKPDNLDRRDSCTSSQLGSTGSLLMNHSPTTQHHKKSHHKRTRLDRSRRKLNQLLHTHVALIAVCVLSSLDATCVIGQIICDILIMSEQLNSFDMLHERAVNVIVDSMPDTLNKSVHGHWSFTRLIEHLEHEVSTDDTGTGGAGSHHDTTPVADNSSVHHMRDAGQSHMTLGTGGTSTHEEVHSDEEHHRTKRASQHSFQANDDDHSHSEHTLQEELTHVFHLGSMAILSILLLETFLKIFAMWKKFLDHKLEVFDAFVVTVSWCLDVAFWEGLWSKPGSEAATILIFILPWRVIRIVNSFVLVIQEKDLVQLKIVKQMYRATGRKLKEASAKLDKYRLEVRQLQGLCRKLGGDESSIQACAPAGRRRRSSLFQSLTNLASVALVSAMGTTPDMDAISSSSDEEGSRDGSRRRPTFSRSMSSDSVLSTPVTFSLSPDPTDDDISVTSGFNNKTFNFDESVTSQYQQTVNEAKKNNFTKL